MPSAAMEWGAASRPKPGEQASGDRQVVVPYDTGTLIAVLDGLGHGEEAAASAAVAESSLRSAPADSLLSIVKRCHADVRARHGARGLVMSIAQFDAQQGALTWIGIGNVEGVVVQSPATRARLLNRGGVLGWSLPPLRAEVIDVSAGGLLVFATDGLDAAFVDSMPMDGRPPQEIADDLLRRHARPHDDALVLAARLPVTGR